MDSQKISDVLDISEPFLMIDSLLELTPGKSCRATKQVMPDDWFMKAHLPSIGLMPGTLMVEAMLQTSVLILYKMDDFKNNKAFVNSIETKLYRNVDAPQKLYISSSLVSIKRGLATINSEIRANKLVLCKGHFSYVCPHLIPQITKKNGIN